MNTRHAFAAAAFGIGLATAAVAQESQPQSGNNMLPEACRTVIQSGMGGDMMQKMEGMQQSMSQSMQSGMQPMMGQMGETQKGLHQAMMDMNGPMMMGMMAKDADVAWVCSMIPHHQGAVDMARAGLKEAENEQSRQLAQETIETNQREIDKLTAWVEQNAQSESQDETTGSTQQ
ncbi:MAG TPA: DUF305 domain-containing protein [Mesorhizobium sp.]|nr:DUF305 domain-containing protein [Mesorhizobium sp.]